MEAGPELSAQVREHLRSGETLRAAIWVSRADDRTRIGLSRAEMSPFRFRRLGPQARRDLQGSPLDLAAGLHDHLRIVTEPRVLARTDQRLMVLSKRSWRDLFGPAAGSGPLRPRWECPSAELASATVRDGRLRLAFTDGSAVTVLTPIAGVQPFLAG